MVLVMIEKIETTKFIRSDLALGASVDGDVIFLEPKAGQYYSSNNVGERVWSLLSEPRTVPEIAEIIVGEFDVAFDQCAHDLEEFISEMLREKLIVRHCS